jgi:hypothetical protein
MTEKTVDIVETAEGQTALTKTIRAGNNAYINCHAKFK